MNLLIVVTLLTAAVGCSGGLVGFQSNLVAFPNIYHGHFTTHPYLLRYGYYSALPRVWQTLIHPVQRGTVTEQKVVSAPLTVKSSVSNQVVALKNAAGAPLLVRPTPIVSQAHTPAAFQLVNIGPVSAPPVFSTSTGKLKSEDVESASKETPTIAQMSTANISPVTAAPVLLKDAERLKTEPIESASKRTTITEQASAAVLTPVTYKTAELTPVNLGSALPLHVAHQAAPPAPIAFQVSAPTPVKIAQKKVVAAPVVYVVKAPSPVKIGGAVPVPEIYQSVAETPVRVDDVAPVPVLQQVSPASTVAYKSAAPLKVTSSAAVSIVPQVAAESPVELNIVPPTAATGLTPIAAVAPTQSQFHAQDEIGQYSFSYYNSLSSRAETRDVTGAVRGAFSYVDPNGQVQMQHYIANTHGFRVAGTNLPVGHGPKTVAKPIQVKPATPLVYARAPLIVENSPAISTSPKEITNLHVVITDPSNQGKSLDALTGEDENDHVEEDRDDDES